MNYSLIFLAGFLLTLGVFAGESMPDTRSASKKIDALLSADWEKNHLKSNATTDDSTFVRRIYLDIVGRIPTTREADTFFSSKEADKRAKLIDTLLSSDGYVQHFFSYWADVLRVQSAGSQAGPITGAAYSNFIKDSIRSNKPYDKFVQEMVAAQGKAWDNGAIGYYMRDRGMPLDNMANTVRVFLGTRIECAQCHNHPFDKWSQMQFYKMAAFTYGVETQDYSGGTMGGARDLMRQQDEVVKASFKQPDSPKKTKEMTEEQWKQLNVEYKEQLSKIDKERQVARENLRKEQRSYGQAFNDIRDTMRYTAVSEKERKLALPHDYKYADAKPKAFVEPGSMMGHEAKAILGETQLQAYARWMTSPENDRFNKVIANRLWKKAFGLALIEPLDELMDTSVPMNPELMAYLEKLVVNLNYDMKGYLRILFNTRAYQNQITREEVPPGVVYHFTGPLLRRMTPEQIWDSFVTLINPSPDMPNLSAREAMEQRVLQAKKNADAIDALSPEEALKGVKITAAVYDRNSAKTLELQKKITAARVAEDKEAVRALSKEANSIQNEGRQVAMAEIMVPGQKKLYEKVTGKPFMTIALTTSKEGDTTPAKNGGDMMMAAGVGKAERVMIPGYDRKELTPEEKAAASEKQRAAYQEEAQFFGIPDKQWKDYFRDRENQSRNWLRAAEVESPAPRGHYLREFGQSDRETIENANTEASVPQALAMMNGQLLPQILGKYSQLMLTVNKAPYPDEKVEAIYMTILSRKPTAAEKDLWLKAQDKGLTTVEDLIFSLLNTQQFIFIQ